MFALCPSLLTPLHLTHLTPPGKPGGLAPTPPQPFPSLWAPLHPSPTSTSTPFHSHWRRFLTALFALAHDPSPAVRKAVCTGLVAVLMSMPERLQPSMTDLIEYMLQSTQVPTFFWGLGGDEGGWQLGEGGAREVCV